MRIRYTWDIGKQTSQRKNLEPVSSTSRRGARAAYYDEYPQDFGPRIAYTVSLVSDTSRPPTKQGGREMSAPRPFKTYPFHPPALFTPNNKINFYRYTTLFQLFLPCGICIVSWSILRMCYFRTKYFKVKRHFKVTLSSMWCRCIRYEIQRGTAIKTRHRSTTV